MYILIVKLHRLIHRSALTFRTSPSSLLSAINHQGFDFRSLIYAPLYQFCFCEKVICTVELTGAATTGN
ncbi:hypothetical protein M5689_011728 [Euphorbia peplus]|nr:hypothetical protein M5689_011728 [Euphorbia peplus]